MYVCNYKYKYKYVYIYIINGLYGLQIRMFNNFNIGII